MNANVTIEHASIPVGHAWQKLPRVFLIIGLIGLALTTALGLTSGARQQLWFSYLVAFMYWLSVALGGLFFVLCHHASRAGWSAVVRRVAETLAVNLWLFVPLFVPIVLGMHDLFHWSHHEAHDPVLAHKAPYLNTTFFLLRAAICLLSWAGLGWFFWKTSIALDATRQAQCAQRMRKLSYPALIIFALTLTIAAFDWMMSLAPHWFSTMFGVIYFAGAAIAVYSILCIVLVTALRSGLLLSAVTDEHLHDLGKLLFAFTVFWAYVSFSQYMLIWYANLPEETAWYRQHLTGSWQYLGQLLMGGHFVIPFFFLMSRHIKRRRNFLMLGAGWMLLMHYLDLYWQIMPTLHQQGIRPSLLDLTAFLGIGGVLFYFVSSRWTRHPLLAISDPRMSEALAFEQPV